MIRNFPALLFSLAVAIVSIGNNIQAGESSALQTALIFGGHHAFNIAIPREGEVSLTSVTLPEPSDSGFAYSFSALPNGKITWLRSETQSPLTATFGQIRVDMFGVGMPPSLAIPVKTPILSPVDNAVVYVGRAAKGGLTLYLLDLTGGAVRQLTTEWGTLMCPSISPDGTHIAFYCSKDPQASYTGGLELHVANIRGGPEESIGQKSQKVYPRPEVERIPPVWASNSRTVYFTACYPNDPPDEYVYQGELNKAGSPLRVAIGDCSSARGEMIYVINIEGIFAIDTSKKDFPKKLLIKGPKIDVPKISPDGSMLAYSRQLDGPVRDTLRLLFIKEAKDICVSEDPVATIDTFYWLSVPPDYIKNIQARAGATKVSPKK